MHTTFVEKFRMDNLDGKLASKDCVSFPYESHYDGFEPWRDSMTVTARERLRGCAIRNNRGVEFQKGTLKFIGGEVTLSELSKEDIERKEKAFSDMKSNGATHSKPYFRLSKDLKDKEYPYDQYISYFFLATFTLPTLTELAARAVPKGITVKRMERANVPTDLVDKIKRQRDSRWHS